MQRRIMRIAIPIAGERVSPLFDVAQRVLLVDIEDGRQAGRTEEVLEQLDSEPRAKRVTELGADALICGAISLPLEEDLLSAGVQVIPEIRGRVEDVLRAFLSGQLDGDEFRMPGSYGGRRRSRSPRVRDTSRPTRDAQRVGTNAKGDHSDGNRR